MISQRIIISAFYILCTSKTASAQLIPSQTITLTTGNQGNVTRRQAKTEDSMEKTFNFSLSTDNQTITKQRNLAPQHKKNIRPNRIRQTQQSQVYSSSFSLERGTLHRTESVVNTDTYDFIDSTLSQSFGMEY